MRAAALALLLLAAACGAQTHRLPQLGPAAYGPSPWGYTPGGLHIGETGQ